jgi:hypothetical protein
MLDISPSQASRLLTFPPVTDLLMDPFAGIIIIVVVVRVPTVVVFTGPLIIIILLGTTLRIKPRQ